MGVGLDPVDAEAAELLADHLQFVIKAGGADGDIGGLLFASASTSRMRAAWVLPDWISVMISGCIKGRGVGRGQADVMQAQDFALAHRDAAGDLGQIFAKGDLVDQLFDFAEFAVSLQALGPFLHLLQRLGVCREPCKAMGGGLVFFDQLAGDAIAVCHDRTHSVFGAAKDIFDRRKGGGGEHRQIGQNWALVQRHILTIMRHFSTPFNLQVQR